MSMGTVKFVEGDDSDNTPLFDQMLKLSKDNATASRKATYDFLITAGVQDKDARAASMYYVVE